LWFPDNNDSLAPLYEVDEKFFDQKIKELVLRYNYTLNQKGIYEAIKYMYTYWPDPTNKTHLREQYIHVSAFVSYMYFVP
jgi:neuroligin